MKSRVHYPKGGRKPGKLTRGSTKHAERLGDPYHFRATMGQSEEQQYRRRMNDYGKKPQSGEPVQNGQMVSPLRTIISV